MARNDLSWQQVQPNFSGSNQMQAIAGNSLSRAGTIFDKTAQYFQQENQRLLQEKMLMDKERSDLFSNIGKQLSNEAMQYATEATVDKNGIVSHQFNSNKYNEYILNKAEENGFKDLSPQDQATIWSNLNMSDNYKTGMANNQANAENNLKRQEMYLDNIFKNKELEYKLAKLNMEANDVKYKSFDNDYKILYQDIFNKVLSGEKIDTLQYSNLIDSMANKTTSNVSLLQLNKLKDLLNPNSEPYQKIKELRDKENSTEKIISYLGSYLNIPKEDLDKIPTIANIINENKTIKNKGNFLDTIANGSFNSDVKTKLQDNVKNKLDYQLNDDIINNGSFNALTNILGEFYYKSDNKKALEDVVNFYTSHVEDDDELSLDIDEIINGLASGNKNNKYVKELGINSDKELDRLIKIAQKQLGIKLNNNNNNNNNNKNNINNNNNNNKMELIDFQSDKSSNISSKKEITESFNNLMQQYYEKNSYNNPNMFIGEPVEHISEKMKKEIEKKEFVNNLEKLKKELENKLYDKNLDEKEKSRLLYSIKELKKAINNNNK